MNGKSSVIDPEESDGVLLGDVGHVIVQAGGYGSRLEHHTRNRPKCLVPVDGRPMLYGLFDRFPRASFIVILDHLAEVCERYLDCFPPAVPVRTMRASHKGTAAGIAEAVRLLPSDEAPFLVVWSDLRIGRIPDHRIGHDIIVGVTAAFPCRWSWSQDGGLAEAASHAAGVMGLFGVPDRRALRTLPAGGEFVRWLAGSGVGITPAAIDDAAEYGTLSALEAARRGSLSMRAFNEVKIGKDTVEKRARDPRYGDLIENEAAWYEAVGRLGFDHIPALLSGRPMVLERVRGEHPFDLDIDDVERLRVLEAIVDALKRLHSYDRRPGLKADLWHVYHGKTLERLGPVRRLASHIAEKPLVTVDGRACRNILHDDHAAWFRAAVEGLGVRPFCPIHGDPTFSNILIDDGRKPWFIDPRGRFGREASIFGDPRYDWAKLYYSVSGGYDAFNAKRFRLRVTGSDVSLHIDGNEWGRLRGRLEDLLAEEMQDVKLIHALIWLSLSGFVEDDHDAIIGAYARGLYLLEDALDR